jgi:hypothetical protein
LSQLEDLVGQLIGDLPVFLDSIAMHHLVSHTTMGVNNWFIADSWWDEGFEFFVSKSVSNSIVTDNHKASFLAYDGILDAKLLAASVTMRW